MGGIERRWGDHMGGMERASYGRDGEGIIWEGWRGHYMGGMERASYGRDGIIWEGWRGDTIILWRFRMLSINVNGEGGGVIVFLLLLFYELFGKQN